MTGSSKGLSRDTRAKSTDVATIRHTAAAKPSVSGIAKISLLSKPP